MTSALRADNVSYAYVSGHSVFANVSTALAGGEVLGIVGPNGSGKSTLLRVLCGLLRPQSGTITLNDKPLAGMSGMERARKVAFLPQAVNPAFALSVFEVVCLGRYPHTGALGALRPHDKAVAERCMRDTETETLRTRDFMTLSGGERQRVLLASILAQEPDLLLLDEPTSALDIHHQIELFALLERLADEGYGVAVVTHDLNLAARFCSRVLLLPASHAIPIQGSPESVFDEGTLSAAYGASIRVARHPITDSPLIWADVPAKCRNEAAK